MTTKNALISGILTAVLLALMLYSTASARPLRPPRTPPAQSTAIAACAWPNIRQPDGTCQRTTRIVRVTPTPRRR